MKPLIVILILIFLAGCGFHINTSEVDRFISVKKSIDYREGAAQGCSSGRSDAGVKYPQAMYIRSKRGKDYQQGWVLWYQRCKKWADQEFSEHNGKEGEAKLTK